jgi:flagellar FliL protein
MWTVDNLFLSLHQTVWAEEEVPAEGETPPEGEGAQQEAVLDVFLKLDPFIVNLKGNGMKRYLKTTIAIEVEERKVKEELEMLTPKLRDTILFVLTSKSYNDLFSNEGKIALKHELIAHINRILKSGTIKAIYITDFIIQ